MQVTITLTPRETQIIAFIGEGYSVKEIATKMQEANSRKMQHEIDKIRMKLGCKNQAHMVGVVYSGKLTDNLHA
jgi:DNA-binding CsgD family transcriptional regulator